MPSLQEAVLFVLTQPVAGTHASSVQTLLSLQFVAEPPTQNPPEHVSAVVQALPSLQEAVLFALTHPVAGTHESSVQTLLSLQFGAEPPTQDPPAQVSAVVQALPSSQEAVLFALTHPVAGTHESSVQTLLSLQFVAEPPTHAPPAQVSAVVQALLSLQDAVLFALRQPVAGTHESSVQGLLSLHEAVLFALTQPVAGTHESSVHKLLSLQFGALPPTHAPPEHVSAVVHALPSLQKAVLFALTHAPPVLHESSVQAFESLQLAPASPSFKDPSQF